MIFKRYVLFSLIAAITWVSSGCSGGSTFQLQNPPPPPATSISIAFQPAPVTAVQINAQVPLTAVVSNDPSSAGVDWNLICPAGSQPGTCGLLSPPHSASGVAVTYTPPSSLPGNSLSVTIVAFATANHSQNITTSITVGAFGSNLKGTYVLQTKGVDTSLQPYQFAGAIALDGNGNITGGEQTVNFSDPIVGYSLTKSDPITSGSYFLGADGRGTLTINTNDTDLGTNGTETFSLVFLSSSQALIADTDPLTSGTGSMDLQTSTASPSGGYAFVVQGTDIATTLPIAWGGVLNIDSPNNISGKGSAVDQSLAGGDPNLGGTVTLNEALTGTVSNPDSFGAVSINLTVPGFANATTFQFTGYIVDGTHIKLIESDDGSGAGSGETGGIAIGQGTATGTFTGSTSFSGTYVFGIQGSDLDSGFLANSFTSAGVFTADGNGNFVNGFTDTLLQANTIQGTSGAQISSPFIGTYEVSAGGTGRVKANFFQFTALHHLPVFYPLFYFYLTGPGSPPLILYLGDRTLNQDYPSLGVGTAYQPTASLAFGGDYGFEITQQNGSAESDATGQMTATNNTLAGTVDINSGFSSTYGTILNGTFTAPSNGQFSGSLNGSVFDSSPLTADFYMIDQGHGFFVETDLVSAPSGVVSFGYYATRTPTCVGCF